MKHESVRKSSTKFDSVPKVVKSVLKHLEKRKQKMRTLWTTLSIFIAFCNVTVVVLAIFVLARLIYTHCTSFNELGPAAFISLFTISIFSLSLTLAIFENIKKDTLYLEAINMIQHKTMKFQMQQTPFILKTKVDNKKLLLQIIDEELENVLTTKYKIKLGKVIIKALVGDPND